MNLAVRVEKWGHAAPDRPGCLVRRLDLFDLSAMDGARPRNYVFLKTLPKNNYGKVLKTELRKQRGQTAGNLESNLVPGRIRQ